VLKNLLNIQIFQEGNCGMAALSLFLIGVLGGLAVSVPLTYYMTLSKKGLSRFDQLLGAKVQAARAEAYKEARDSLYKDFLVEQTVYQATEGYIFKRHYVVVNERILFRRLPLLGWIEHRCVVKEELDESVLKLIAQATSIAASCAANRQTRILANPAQQTFGGTGANRQVP
jgi:hypothetical protein